MISDVCSAVAVFSVSAGICSFANGFRICAASMCAPFCVWLAWLILKLSFSFLNIVKLALVYKKVLGSRRYLAHVFYALSIRYERHAARACLR